MDLLDMMKKRRSIRKYIQTPVERDKLDKICEAGLYAPSPGGRQGTKIILIEDADLIETIGIVNAACENRDWSGKSVSAEQPSIIDDLSIRSGFYGCTALGIICVSLPMRNVVNGIGSAFVCAQNMVMEAYALGVSSCIVGRAEATFANPQVQALSADWGLEAQWEPVAFVCMGYIDGAYPQIKPRLEGRLMRVEEKR